MLRDLRDKLSHHLLSRLGVRIANRTCAHLRLRITWPVRRLMRALYPVEPASTSSGRIVSVVTVGRPSGARHHNSSDQVAVPSCSAAGCPTHFSQDACAQPALACGLARHCVGARARPVLPIEFADPTPCAKGKLHLELPSRGDLIAYYVDLMIIVNDEPNDPPVAEKS